MTTEPRILFPSTTSMKKVAKAYQASPQSTLPDGFSGTRAVCLDFSPFFKELCIVGQLDGGCRVHHINLATPLITWPYYVFSRCTALNATCVVSDLKWSPNVPNIFFVLHANGDLHAFDLNREDSAPVYSCALSAEVGFSESSPPLTKMAISRGLSNATELVLISFGETIFKRAMPTASEFKERDLGEFLDRLITLAGSRSD